jgi:pilus assembly protein CpaB
MSSRGFMIVLFLGLAAALGLFAYQLNIKPPPAAAPPVPAAPQVVMVPYLVAARPLPLGTLARADDFNVKTVRSDQVPRNAIVDTPDVRANLRGALIRHYLEAGAMLAQSDFTRPRERGFLAAVLAPGTRAVSIGVNAVSGVAGLISPGDNVDIILTQEIQQSGGRSAHLVTSETVLSNVRVLAVDQDIAQGAPPSASGTGRSVATVTVQATSNEAERLAVATRLGQLTLAVRSVDDARPAAGASVSGADVSTALARAGGAIGSRVQVIQGDQRSEVIFR